MAAPEIVLGASLLTLFLNQALLDLGFWTIFIAHVMFCISFVVVTVRARLVDFDRHLEEAAADLGATGLATFRLVTLPLLWPAILAGGLLGLRHLRRRLRHHLLQLRQRDHVPRLRLGPGRPGSPAAGQRDRLRDLPRRCRDHARQRHRPDPPPEGNRRMTATAAADLQQAARDHLWMHFTRMSGYASNEVPIIVRGDGCYLEDSNGKRYLDALAGLFSVNIGYGFGEEIGQAALAQMKELPFYTNWSYAHPRAIELASELASLAPGDLNRAFFVSGGSEAVESAWKLARQYFLARGGKRIEGADETRHDERVGAPPPRKYKAIARQVAYHGTTHGRALDQRHPGAADAVRAARAGGAARDEHEPLPPSAGGDRGGVHAGAAREPRGHDRLDGAGDRLPDPHGARPERRRRLHPAGGLLAGRPRALRPLRHPALRGRGDHRVRPRRPLVRLGALRHPPGHRLLREGPLLLVRGDRCRDRERQGDGALPRGRVDVRARDHLRRPPRDVARSR